MEAFNLLKFWRNSSTENLTGSEVITDIDYVNSDYHKTPITSSITSDVRNRAPNIDCESDEDDDDDDSFFELEFSALDCKADKELKDSCKFPESPTDVLNSNALKSHSTNEISRGTPKFKILMLRFKKSKTEAPRKSFESGTRCSNEVPVISRDNSLRTKMMREILEESNFASKKSEKDVKKYLKLIKPLYTVASKRHRVEKIRSSKNFSAVSPMCSPATVAAAVSSPRRSSDDKFSGLKVVYKHLGKSRSASSAGAGVIPSPVNRRDDSLLLHNDGIQSAILHCKRSYNCTDKELSRCSI